MPQLAWSTLNEWFADVAAKTPDAIAVRHGDEQLTYRELDERSAGFATQLAQAGVAPGSLVALRLCRSVNIPSVILAIYKHGCAYVPLDPMEPSERHDFILEDSGATAILSDEDNRLAIAGQVKGSPHWPASLAYLMYTSGSTGTPKGVMIGQKQVIALLGAAQEHYSFGSTDVWSLFSSYAFDMSIWEIWGCLLHGGCLTIPSDDCIRNPHLFADFLENERVTVLNQVPTVFTYLVRALEERPRRLNVLRFVFFGGEDLYKDAFHRWWRLGVAPRARLINMYGITEITVHATHGELTPETIDGWDGHSLIGEALPHLTIHLQDESGHPVPTGVAGEIVVSGAGVALGYLNRPELNRERFIQLKDTEGLAYRSGDWARRNEEGRLFYIGRKDFQVQLRGFRIEPGEVEARLEAHPQIRTCVVTAPTNAVGEPVLVAHFTTVNGVQVTPDELRRFMAAVLPAHMVPSRFVAHDELPTTTAGKVDRRALDVIGERESRRV